MVEKATAQSSVTPPGNEVANGGHIRFGLSGCHDTTLAAVLTSMGAFEGEHWPPYSSHIAIELFRERNPSNAPTVQTSTKGSPSWWSAMFGPAKSILTPNPSSRTPLSQLSITEKQTLDGYYVRMRYNDRVMTVPGCKAVGSHYKDDESLCTLEAFKEVADKFTPQSWKRECKMNLKEPAVPRNIEPAGLR